MSKAKNPGSFPALLTFSPSSNALTRTSSLTAPANTTKHSSGRSSCYHRKKFLDEFKMRFQKILIKDCRRFPILIINPSDLSVKTRYDQIVSLVGQMLSLNKQLPSTKTDHEKTALQRQIDATDKQIDQLVYELYGLRSEEIRIVEGAAK